MTHRDKAPDPRGTDLASSRSGHTLVELAVAIAIVAILAGMGWYSVQDEVDRYRMMQAARLLQSDVQTLRALAIATSREARLCLTAADAALDPADVQVGEWLLQAGDRSTASVAWDTLPIDEGSADSSQGERSLDPDGANEAPHISLAPWTTLNGPGVGNANCLVFSPRGWITNPAGDFADGYVALRLVDKRALGRGQTAEATVRISRGGLARLEVGASSTLPANSVGTADASSP